MIRTEAHVAYPRRGTGPTGTEAQQDLYASATRTTVAHLDTRERFLIGVSVETEEFDLFGVAPSSSGVVLREPLLADLLGALAAPLDVHETATAGLQARRSEWERAFYWNDARTDARPLGQVGAPLLVHHEETACFTDELVADVYGGRIDAGMLIGEGGYTAADGYWRQPGPTYHHRDRGAFYSLEEEVAPGGAATRFTFDAAVLVHTEVRDALGNATRIETDYQALAASRVTDPNGTITETRYDPLGVAVLTALRGTVRGDDGAEDPYGSDPLAAYVEPPRADLGRVLADPAVYLQQTDRYLFYDAHAWARDGTPPHAVTLAREALVHDGEGGGTAAGPVQVAVSYSDGFGRALQQKQRIEAGPAIQRDLGGEVVLDAGGAPVLADASERWLVSGHTVYNNKGQPVRQYEPFFSTTPAFEADDALQRYGVAAEHHYDALGQPVRTDLPNGTFVRTERTPWLERQHDTNDSVADSAYRLAREILPPSDPERQALDGALVHADTPTTTHFDPLGREILVVERGEGATEIATRQRYDGGGPLAEVVDPRGLTAFTYRHDMLGRALYERSADAGERWTLPNLDGDPAHAWDARGVHLATSYDLLGRPTTLHVDGALGLDQGIERWTYGEALPEADAVARNARGRLIEHHDAAGVLTLHEFAPGGAPLRHSRRLRADYRTEPDWDDPGAVALDPDVFESRTRYDAPRPRGPAAHAGRRRARVPLPPERRPRPGAPHDGGRRTRRRAHPPERTVQRAGPAHPRPAGERGPARRRLRPRHVPHAAAAGAPVRGHRHAALPGPRLHLRPRRQRRPHRRRRAAAVPPEPPRPPGPQRPPPTPRSPTTPSTGSPGRPGGSTRHSFRTTTAATSRTPTPRRARATSRSTTARPSSATRAPTATTRRATSFRLPTPGRPRTGRRPIGSARPRTVGSRPRI